MRRVRLRRTPLVAIMGVLVILAGACASSGSSGGSAGGRPEKTHLTVGTLPVPEASALFIAIRRGFFKQQGLTVTPQIVQATPQTTSALLAGTMDFSFFNYVSTFEQEERGLRFKIVADASQGAPNYLVAMVPKGSPITSPTDLKGKTIAVPAPNALGTLGIDTVVKAYGITQNQMKFVSIPFPNMTAALETHQVDAVNETEPFVTQMESSIGAHVLADVLTGPMDKFPLGGWGTTAQYVQKYPRTVAAFQRAMARAQQIIATDRSAAGVADPTNDCTWLSQA